MKKHLPLTVVNEYRSQILMKWKLLSLIILFGLLFLTMENVYAYISTSTTTIITSADAHVLEEFPDTNYGTYIHPNVAWRYGLYSNWNSTTWLKFDLSSLPADASITSAKLCIKTFTVTPPVVNALFCSDDSWTESGITWNNQPTPEATILDAQTLSSAETWYNFTILSKVQSEFAGDKIVSIELNTNSVGKIANLYSRETSNAPYLAISYEYDQPVSGDVNLSNIPIRLAEQLDISLFAGGLLASSILVLLFILPTLVLTKNRLAPLITGVMAFGITIALGWMPIYLFAVVGLMIILFYGKAITEKF